ncbi:hypothetical protein KCU81_g6793, partial [Aureobasidium melanogenum]|uniref:Uncharacterized protein n=1 Tax=Aureobasidium melanogenum (strain CBS 110374) TaxID=1043003 RepID=A0A074VT56_AURM1
MNDHALEGDVSVDARDAHQDKIPFDPSAMTIKARHERAMEVTSQAKKLAQEMEKIDAEGPQHYREWNRCNRRYLRLQKRMGNVEEPLILDFDDTAQLQKASDLLALDTQRANAQLAMVQIRQRMLEIEAEIKELYIEFTILTGGRATSSFAKDLEWFVEEEKRHHKIRKDLGEQMLKSAGIGQD